MTKTMFDDILGQGTLEIQDRHGKLLGRKAVDLDTFSIKNFAKHLREGYTLNLYRLPLEFDAVTTLEKKEIDAPPAPQGGTAARPAKTHVSHDVADDPFADLYDSMPSIKVYASRPPLLIEAWGYTLDMSYSRHFKAEIRVALAKHLGKDRSDVNDKHKLSVFGISAPKVPDILKLFNIPDLVIKPNFVKMTFKQFVGLLHRQYTLTKD
jgi:hypothetical protein